jgi:hypothetical protein
MMTTYYRSEFPIRPFPKKGESLAGYLFRLYSANGHGITLEVMNTLKDLYSANESHQLGQAFLDIQVILGSMLDACLDQEFWTWEKFFYRVAPLWHRWNIDTDIHLKFCPQCFAQYEYHLLLWELTHLTVCPVHQCELLDRCPDCARTLSWQTLRPNWSCFCGTALIEMQATVVAGIRSAISRYLGAAIDLPHPPNFPTELLRRALNHPLELQYIYLRLHDFELLRAFINLLSTDEYYSAWRTSGRAECHVRSPGRWTARLLYEWPTGFQRTLLRLAKYHFRRSTTTLIHLIPPTAELAVVDYLCALEEYSWIDAPIRIATQDLIRSIRVPLSFRSLVIYSPGLTKPQRDHRLTAFTKWWNSLCTWRKQFDYENPSPSMEHFAYPILDNQREERIINILNVMITAATIDHDDEIDQQIILRWPTPQPAAERDDPEILLKTLTEQLTVASMRRISTIECPIWQLKCLFDNDISSYREVDLN